MAGTEKLVAIAAAGGDGLRRPRALLPTAAAGADEADAATRLKLTFMTILLLVLAAVVSSHAVATSGSTAVSESLVVMAGTEGLVVMAGTEGLVATAAAGELVATAAAGELVATAAAGGLMATAAAGGPLEDLMAVAAEVATAKSDASAVAEDAAAAVQPPRQQASAPAAAAAAVATAPVDVAEPAAAAAANLKASLVRAMRGHPAAPISARRWLAMRARHVAAGS